MTRPAPFSQLQESSLTDDRAREPNPASDTRQPSGVIRHGASPAQRLLPSAASLLFFLILPIPGNAANVISIRPGGNMRLNGTDIFPFGFYHISESRSASGTTTDLSTLGTNNFNLVHLSIDVPSLDPATVLDNAQSSSLGVLTEFWWTPTNASYRQDFVTTHKSHPAMWGWNIGDDVNYPAATPRYTPAQIQARTAELKGYAPDLLTYGAFLADPASLLGAIYPLSAYAGTCDVVGIESYPRDGGNTPTANEIEYHATTCLNAETAFNGTSTTWWIIPQTFTWNTTSPQWPTNAESRNMLFASLIYGAKGVLCYTYWDESTHLPTDRGSLWNYYRQTLRPEVSSIQADLLQGTRTRATGLAANVHAARWTSPTSLLIMAANTHRTLTRTFSLPLTGNFTQAPAAVFPLSSTTTFPLTNGVLQGTLAPLKVVVFRITMGTPLEAWRYTSFGTSANTGNSADLADPDGDGVPNLIEFALGTNPAAPSSAGLPSAILLPAPDSRFQLTFNRRKASTAPGITYAVEFSNDLAISDPWAVNPSATESVTSLDATFERVNVTDSVASPAKRFARVKVTSQ